MGLAGDELLAILKLKNRSCMAESLDDNYNPFSEGSWLRRHVTVTVAGLRLLGSYYSEDGIKGVLNGLKRPDKATGLLPKGLLQGAILGNSVLYPDSDRLVYDQALAGQWVAYDLNRPQESPEDLISKGQLGAFMLNRVVQNPPNKLTPNSWSELGAGTLSAYRTFSLPSTLVEAGFLHETTLHQAYAPFGGEYPESLRSRDVHDDKAYVVTPKGNGLVILMDHLMDDDDPTPKYVPEAAVGWVPPVA